MARLPRRGGIIQRRATRIDGWTKARKTEFLARLTESCNVRAACGAMGLNPGSAYRRRSQDAEFARQWEWALQQGYVRLETELLRRAIGDEPLAEAAAAVFDRDAVAMPFDPDLAFKMLAQRARTDASGRRGPVRFVQPMTHDVLDALDRRLTTMEKRLERRS